MSLRYGDSASSKHTWQPQGPLAYGVDDWTAREAKVLRTRNQVVTLHRICNQDVEEAADRRKEENAVENCDLEGREDVSVT